MAYTPTVYVDGQAPPLSLRDYIGGAMLGEAESVSVTVGKANVVDVVMTGAVSA